MSREPDYYAIIQVHPRAEKEVIEAAYRRLATKYHPDLDPSPGSTERMKLINAAYEVLSDPEKRRAYDLRRGIFSGPPPVASTPPVRTGGYPQWVTSLALTILLTAITAGGARLGPKVIVVVLLVGLIGWLLMSLRKS